MKLFCSLLNLIVHFIWNIKPKEQASVKSGIKLSKKDRKILREAIDFERRSKKFTGKGIFVKA
jgi:hypothetical protein